MSKYALEPNARALLDSKFALCRSSSPGHLAPLKFIDTKSQYKSIMNTRYEKDLLNLAISHTSCGRALTLEAAKQVWEAAMDGNVVTQIEHQTIEYICDFYRVEEEARNFLKAQLELVASPPKRKRTAASHIDVGTSADEADATDGESPQRKAKRAKKSALKEVESL